MKKHLFSMSALSTILFFVLFIAGCGGVSTQVSPTAINSQNCLNAACSDDNQSVAEKNIPKTNCQNPVIVGGDFDQTGSMRWSGTAATSVDDLKPLIELIANCGGELGVTFVRSDSAKPIERFRAGEPPPPLTEPKQKPDEEDYEFADRMDEYSQKITERNEIVRQNRTALQPKIQNYLEMLAPLMARPPKGSTDLWSGINRLDVFLSEGDDSWQIKPHRYLIVVSDGADTVGKEKRPFKSVTSVIWVNATASEKTMKDFPYQRVENFAAAVREILAKERGQYNGK